MSRRLGHTDPSAPLYLRHQHDFHIYVVKNTGDCPMTEPIWGKFVGDFFALLLGT